MITHSLQQYPAEINPPEEMDLKMYLFNKPVLYPESDTRIYGASMLFRRLSELAGIAFSPATEEQFATSVRSFYIGLLIELSQTIFI